MASSMYQHTPPAGRPPPQAAAAPPPPPGDHGHYAQGLYHSYAPPPLPPPPHYPGMPAAEHNPYNPNSLPPHHHHPGYAGQGYNPSSHHHMHSSSYTAPHYGGPPAQHSSGSYPSHPHQGTGHGHQGQGLGPSANRYNQATHQAWSQKMPPGQGSTTIVPQGAHSGYSGQVPPQGLQDTIPARRQETKEERAERKKREYYEKKKADERHQREKIGSGARPTSMTHRTGDLRGEKKVVPADEKVENRLKRSSTFLCKIKFRSELPDCVSQPKLLHINTDKDQYTKYTITTLEKTYKHKLFVEPDLGIPLDLLDISGYRPPAGTVPLDPLDAELLLDDEVLKKKEPESIRKKERPTDKGVAWLVKTQYISPFSLESAKHLITEREAKVLREEREGRRLDVETTNDRDQQIQAIEESFRLSKLMPVHQTKPELEPVEIIPLLPDFDRVADQFVHIVFDTDPLAEADALTDLDQEARYELESRAIIRSFTIPGAEEDSQPERLVGYMVPKPEELQRDIYDDDEEIGYTWVREYHWDMRKETEKSYVFCFGGDTVTYVPLSTKLVLQKKKAKEGKSKYEIERDFEAPSEVTIQRRDFSQEEEDERDVLRQKFMEGGVKRRHSPDVHPSSSKRQARVEQYSDEDNEVLRKQLIHRDHPDSLLSKAYNTSLYSQRVVAAAKRSLAHGDYFSGGLMSSKGGFESQVIPF